MDEILDSTKFEKRNFSFLKENEQGEHGAEISNSRISVQIINFEWIFEEDNCYKFLDILVNDAKKSTFKHKSI
jgi:hypothetical protein